MTHIDRCPLYAYRYNGQPVPWQLKGFGSNLAFYVNGEPFRGIPFHGFDPMTYQQIFRDPPIQEMTAINRFMKDLFSCVAQKDGLQNEFDLSIFGEGRVT